MNSNNIPSLPFGKTYRVGNFSVVKLNRTLSKKQKAELRGETHFPKELAQHLHRAGLPVIKVSAISGIWSVEVAAPSTMFMFLDSRDMENEHDNLGLHNLFINWFTDTSLMGDKEYWDGKGKLLQEFISRQNPAEVSAEDEAKALKEIEEMDKARRSILDAAETLTKE